VRALAALCCLVAGLAGCQGGEPQAAAATALAAAAAATASATAAPASATVPPAANATSTSSTMPSSAPLHPDEAAALAAAKKRSPVKADEQVQLFPAYAHRSADGADWELEIRAWIYEPEEDSTLRNALLGKLALRADLLPAERAILDRRLRAFLVDNERGKELSIAVAGSVLELGPSAKDGHATGTFKLPGAAATRAQGGVVTMEVVLRAGDERRFTAPLLFVEPSGTTIVSDIDDTVKVSEVLDKKRLLARTFLEELEAVPGMAPLYQRLVPSGAHLHFVSSSPWQLYEPLAALMASAGFPAATIGLKRIRPRNVFDSVEALLLDPLESKPPAIRALLERFPRRTFILVGDSGEKDPEVYGLLAREHPAQIARILIRDVTREPRAAPRYAKAFAGVHAERWELFTDPAAVR
jgi:hypothetical protein